MTQDEIIEMARQAGFDCYGKHITWDDVNCTDELIAFAKLAAAKEREACAKVSHPPQRTWVDLTRTQMQDVYFAVLEKHRGDHQMVGQLAFGEALQAKIKEKNSA
jgi:F420-0:gamma-glutamyl ligase